MTISELAKKVEVNIETIRYYERRGLILDPPRLESGYRDYSQDVVKRIHFIKRAKELGFSLKEVSELLSLRVDPDITCGDVKQRAEAKIISMEEKIETLHKMKTALTELVISCNEQNPTSECPILEAMDTTVEQL